MLTVRNCQESDKQYLRLGEPEQAELVDLSLLAWEYLICIDEPEKIKFQHTKNVGSTYSLKMEFKFCTDSPECYPEEYIIETLTSQSVNLFLVHNKSVF